MHGRMAHVVLDAEVQEYRNSTYLSENIYFIGNRRYSLIGSLDSNIVHSVDVLCAYAEKSWELNNLPCGVLSSRETILTENDGPT